MKKSILSIAMAMAFMAGCGGGGGEESVEKSKSQRELLIEQFQNICKKSNGTFAGNKNQKLKSGGTAGLMGCANFTGNTNELKNVCSKLKGKFGKHQVPFGGTLYQAYVCSDKAFDEYKF